MLDAGRIRRAFQLTRYDDKDWRARSRCGRGGTLTTSATGTAWEPTPWHATQRAAWERFRRAAPGDAASCGPVDRPSSSRMPSIRA